MPVLPIRFAVVALATFACLSNAYAEAGDAAQSVDEPFYQPQALWLNPGDFSYHFNRDLKYREDNWGVGAQIEFPHDLALLGGSFINSDNQHSYDAGVLWQPVHYSVFKFGAVAGAFNGYPNYHHGDWFPALLPMVTATVGRFGVNLTAIPNYKDRLHGALVAQVIFRVW